MLKKMTLSGVNSKKKWDDLLNQCQNVDLSQTWEIGVAMQRCHGWEPCRDIILYRDQPIAIVQTLIKQFPILGGKARINGGPLFITINEALIPNLKIQVIRFLHRYWSQQKGMIVHIAPCILADEIDQHQFNAIGLVRTDDEPWFSIKIDLSLDENILFKNMQRDWRKKLNKAKKKYGLTVEIDNSDRGFNFTMEKYEKEFNQKGFSFTSPDFVKAIRIASENSKRIQILFTTMNQERIGGHLTIGYGDTSYSLISWNSPVGRRFDSDRLLHWESMLLFKKMGYRWYDLGGVNEKKWPGITNFKRGVGGHEFVYVGNFKTVPHKLFPRTLNKLIELKRKCKKKSEC